MSRRVLACIALLACIASLAAAGCSFPGHNTSATTTTTPLATTTTQAPTMSVVVFRVENGTLVAQSVTVPQTAAVAEATLKALGVSATVTITNGTATVQLTGATPDQIAEIVYTLTQFASVERVDVAGHTGLTRDDVASYLPEILIDSPAAGSTVPLTFHVTGTASVFEGTLVVELVQNGAVAVKQTVTASAGAPDRGAFDTTITAPAGASTVVAFAPSAENGAPQHQVEVPITVGP